MRKLLHRIVPGWLWNFLKERFYRLLMWLARVQNFFFGRKIDDYHQIPIVINNYNRLSYLQRLIQSLEERGYRNLYIIDNDSTYPPLLEYYKTIGYKVYFLGRNVGYKAMWKTSVYKDFKRSYYVYTDSDLELDPDCPADFMAFFLRVLDQHRCCQKVGFGIRIDDLPDCYCLKKSVIADESKFWQHRCGPLFRASIDTTFALYRPFCKGPANDAREVYRSDFPYVARHLPWYVDTSHLSDEENYYVHSGLIATEWSKVLKETMKP